MSTAATLLVLPCGILLSHVVPLHLVQYSTGDTGVTRGTGSHHRRTPCTTTEWPSPSAAATRLALPREMQLSSVVPLRLVRYHMGWHVGDTQPPPLATGARRARPLSGPRRVLPLLDKCSRASCSCLTWSHCTWCSTAWGDMACAVALPIYARRAPLLSRGLQGVSPCMV